MDIYFLLNKKKELVGVITTHEGCMIIQPIVEFATTQRHAGYKCFFFFFFGVKKGKHNINYLKQAKLWQIALRCTIQKHLSSKYYIIHQNLDSLK